ncbi:MAG: GNAT family N-acetyltransferase [Pseudomonadota bacterium]
MNQFDADLSRQGQRVETPKFHLRYANPGEISSLNSLCRQSKRHWGYDDDFMRKAESELMVPANLIAQNLVLVADSDAGLIGVGALERTDDQTFDLSHLFVHPKSIGFGVGRALFTGLTALASGLGGTMMTVLSDPNALAFYEALGAVKVGEEKSSSETGRMLPLLHYDLTK